MIIKCHGDGGKHDVEPDDRKWDAGAA